MKPGPPAIHPQVANPLRSLVHHRACMDTTSSTISTRPTRLWRRLLWIWAAFWLLQFLIGTQEYLWTGGRQFWRPVIDYGTAALLSTALAAIQIRRSLRFDYLLGQPARWFLHVWAWMPAQLAAFIAAMHGLRFVFFTLDRKSVV